MKKIVRVLCLTALMIGFGAAAGDFASDASNGPTLIAAYNSGVPLTYEQVGKDATVGFGLGYRASYRFDIGYGLVAPFANIDFMWNTISGKWSDKYLDAKFSSPTYFNIPLLAGVSYIYDDLPWDDISAYGEFGVGTDLLWITSEGADDFKFAYKPTFAFAWMLGAGAYFGEHVSVGLYYYGLGKHTIDYTQGTLDDNMAANAQVTANEAAGMGRQQRSVGSVMLRIGFHF